MLLRSGLIQRFVSRRKRGKPENREADGTQTSQPESTCLPTDLQVIDWDDRAQDKCSIFVSKMDFVSADYSTGLVVGWFDGVVDSLDRVVVSAH